MELNALTAISPVDGRYRGKTSQLAPYFSEFALIKYRVIVEVEYFVALCKLPLPQLNEITDKNLEDIALIVENFSENDAVRIKTIERTTNHDVKAVEYFLKEEFAKLNLSEVSEFIHFGLTSQDINNTSIPKSLYDFVYDEYIPELDNFINALENLSTDWASVSMLAKTHGQPASPTKLGKEFYVFVERLKVQLKELKTVPFSAKFGGATGNFNAHHVAYPAIDWISFANAFVNDQLGLTRSQVTTQIEHYDNLARLFDGMKRINTIMIDLSRDIWSYISMNYFKQKIVKGEVGSSAMPHKVNPIDFENAEGNLGIASALLEHLSYKLPVSRLQRDLTDSTVLRNIGMPFGHITIALQSLQKGLSKLVLNEAVIHQDLEDNWIVVAEAIQTVLRREGIPNPYEQLKELTRTNSSITETTIADFINELDIDDALKSELKQISPFNYTGVNLV